jgi:hypothetical protein
MKKKTTIWVNSLVMTIALLMLVNSCKKGETTAVKNDPIITWTNPADITYPTLLGTAQLNAAANVSGTFTYLPATGTKLNSGANQVLKVDFAPTDAANYNTISKTVKINVLPLNISNTTWDVLIINGNSSWHADLTFYADGTTKYDEPANPGAYLSYGTWTLTDDKIHWVLDPSIIPNYVFDGIITNNTMSGTYVFNANTETWSAVIK